MKHTRWCKRAKIQVRANGCVKLKVQDLLAIFLRVTVKLKGVKSVKWRLMFHFYPDNMEG